MAYTRLNLSDGEVFNASHVSHIEDGIEDCETQLSEVNQSLSDFSVYKTTWDSFIEWTRGLNTQRCALFSATETVASILTNGSLTRSCRGILVKLSSDDYFDFMIYAVVNSGGVLYCGRYNESLLYCSLFTGASVV